MTTGSSLPRGPDGCHDAATAPVISLLSQGCVRGGEDLFGEWGAVGGPGQDQRTEQGAQADDAVLVVTGQECGEVGHPVGVDATGLAPPPSRAMSVASAATGQPSAGASRCSTERYLAPDELVEVVPGGEVVVRPARGSRRACRAASPGVYPTTCWTCGSGRVVDCGGTLQPERPRCSRPPHGVPVPASKAGGPGFPKLKKRRSEALRCWL